MQSPTAHQRRVGHSMITCLLYKQIIERLALKELDMSADLKRQLPLVAVAFRSQERVSCIGGSIAIYDLPVVGSVCPDGTVTGCSRIGRGSMDTPDFRPHRSVPSLAGNACR